MYLLKYSIKHCCLCVKQMEPEKLDEKAEKASRLQKSMSHPSRLMVLCHLMNVECPESALYLSVPLSQPPLSQHLASLRGTGLVETRRENQVVYFRLNNKSVPELITALYRIYCN